MAFTASLSVSTKASNSSPVWKESVPVEVVDQRPRHAAAWSIFCSARIAASRSAGLMSGGPPGRASS